MTERSLDPARLSDLRMLLSDAGIAPRHSLGQNFLVNPRVCDRIVALILEHGPARVWEVGPGAGQLTSRICATDGVAVTAFERDPGILPALRRACAHCPDLEVIQGDALSTVAAALTEQPVPDVLAGNLPYGIAAVLIGRILRAANAPAELVVMVQREVAERMAAGPGSPQYSAFSVLCAARARVRIALRVGPGHFHPRPRVDSAVVTMQLDQRMPSGLPDLVNRAFASRRKTLRNNLCRADDAPQMEAALAAAGISPDLRAETLSVDDYLRILAAMPA